MIARRAAVITVVTAVAVTVAVLVFAGPSSTPRSQATSEAAHTATAEPTPRHGGALEDCSSRSEANFPGAFDDPGNLVVGPLVLVGGAFTPASTVREYGGDKFPLLVKAGHTVTVRLARTARGAGLAYGPLPQGRQLRVRDTYRSVTFAACRPGKAPRHYSPDGPSGSYADKVAVTFWSGFVLARRPACIPLEVYVDEAATPVRVGLPLGRSCAT
jgi:hypothetical protein